MYTRRRARHAHNARSRMASLPLPGPFLSLFPALWEPSLQAQQLCCCATRGWPSASLPRRWTFRRDAGGGPFRHLEACTLGLESDRPSVDRPRGLLGRRVAWGSTAAPVQCAHVRLRATSSSVCHKWLHQCEAQHESSAQHDGVQQRRLDRKETSSARQCCECAGVFSRAPARRVTWKGARPHDSLQNVHTVQAMREPLATFQTHTWCPVLRSVARVSSRSCCVA